MWAVPREWTGETVFILAGGASVLSQDLSLLSGRRVIAINSAWKTYPQADVLFFADTRWWTKFHPDFGGLVVTTCAWSDKRIKNLKKIAPGKGIATRPDTLALETTSVTGAINLAVHFGASRIVLLGVDGQIVKGQRHHHTDAYPWPFKGDSFGKHAAEFRAVAASIPVPVINCSPVSNLDIWPKMTLEEAVKEPMLQRLSKPSLVVLGMYGMGDCLHQRAVLREMMKTHSVEVQTYYTAIYHDLEAEGLRVTISDRLPPRIRDRRNVSATKLVRQPDKRIGYDHAQTKRHGTLLAAMFGSVGLKVPARPDFSLPVKPAWRAAARKLVGDTGGKPILVYRPIVLNATWPCPSRSPDVAAYAALYRSIKDRFFTVSVCDLTQKGEHIVGEEQDADLKLHKGEADFETLAGLFAEASLVFGNAGFTPILAQAVGTPNICVYGGNESFRFTNIVGKHLAPTLPIEPAKPCECFDRHHQCNKTIDLTEALPKVEDFAEKHGKLPRVLVFGTTYVDTLGKQRLAAQWEALHRQVNGTTVDLLLVDSASPVPLLAVEQGAEKYAFPDNIGHLARGGKDGWGRAFCKGLEMSIDGQYDYVVHIEGDSLFKRPVLPIIRQMMATGVKAASVPVEGTKRNETGWAETGLMFFSVDYLWQSKFIEKYDWWNRQAKPYPEQAIFDILGADLQMLQLKAERGDRGQITAGNVAELDWVTHATPEAYEAFVASTVAQEPAAGPVADAIKLNFGCGTNRLDGWRNFDAEVDIEKRLPFADDHADFIYAEHVVEHVDYHAALRFFTEARRVLKPGGIIRICVPSLENIWRRGDQDYFDFASKWAPSADRRGAMHAIIHAHGHKAIWSQALLEACLFFAGFEDIAGCEVHKSAHADLTDVEGHHTVIGEHFNWIEAAVAEGRK
ncbi:methyltransferase domain-containing protein [Mesorhizobium sp. M0514]|uniref:methyltransferase domain-containing protein n=1 Tax=Mesorhizobium sp. M0514 TaxID=2956955 RepID=UPI0033377582